MENKKPLVRVTQIEQFRRYLQQSEFDNFEITEQSVIDTITGDFTGNQYTRIGTAFHSIVESGKPQCQKAEAGVRTFTYYGRETTEPVPEGRTFDVDGYEVLLDVTQCRVALDYRTEHPHAFHEIRLQKDYGDIIVTGQADMIDGCEIHDIKTKFSSVRDTDYTSSYQWRLYLDIFGTDVFHYDFFEFKGYNIDKHGYDVRGLKLERRAPAITCYRYPQMQDDIMMLLDQFKDWVKQRDLTKYLLKDKI